MAAPPTAEMVGTWRQERELKTPLRKITKFLVLFEQGISKVVKVGERRMVVRGE